jgi:carboxymethylenebutenolidase
MSKLNVLLAGAPPTGCLLAFVFLAACGGSDDYADRMAHEHAGETPSATAATDGADTLAVTEEQVVYATVGGTPVTGYLVRPEGAEADALPGLIVIHEWWGLNDHVRAMARRLAAEGYAALAVDLYEGRVAESADSARAILQDAMADEAGLTENLTQAYRYLGTQQRAPRVGVVGWCFGGGWALRTALALPDSLDAAVVYYGEPVTDRARLATLNVPILGLFGSEDQGIPVDRVGEMERALQELGKDAQILVYEGADHAFANPTGERYHAPAAEDAWAQTTAFLERTLKGGPRPAPPGTVEEDD